MFYKIFSVKFLIFYYYLSFVLNVSGEWCEVRFLILAKRLKIKLIVGAMLSILCFIFNLESIFGLLYE